MRRHIVILCVLLAASALRAATLVEDFACDPRSGGWRVFGESNLFSWNATAQNFAVTWDSAQTNSYFLLPLGTVLATNDSFRVEFDLWLDDIATGVNPEKPFTFELSLGFVRLASATNASLQRGAGVNPATGPRNLVEFDYFPDSGFGATIWPALISSNGQFNYRGLGDYALAELTTNQWHHVTMAYSSTNRGLVTTVLTNGQLLATHSTRLTANFNDFRLDAFAICSYQDTGSDGSLLAHGRVDNIVVTIPDPPIVTLLVGWPTNGAWQGTFITRTNWLYTLQRSTDFDSWTPLDAAWGNGVTLTLTDTNPPAPLGVYRVSADRP